MMERDHLEDLGLDGKTILKWIFKQWKMGMDWIDLISVLVWDITQRVEIIYYRSFGTIYSPIFKCKDYLDILTLEGCTDRLSRNVGKELTLYAV
jgi:hypothetical protein